jgi:transposase
VLDNARYQHAKIVKELADGLGIELLFLPAYSPNLNLIERLWKFVKKECLYSEYYENFGLFTEAIQNCLSKVGTDEYEPMLKTLLNLKFQKFNKVQFVKR